MSPNITQIIFALGAGDQLVGVDEFSVYPEQAKNIPTMGSYLDPDLESLIVKKPGMVLILDTDERMAELLAGIGVPYKKIPNDTIEQILFSIERLGELTGTQDKADELIQDFYATRDEIADKLKDVPKTKVAMVVGRNPGRLQDIYVAGGNNFLGELIEMAGGENVFGDLTAPWPQIGAESIIGTDPDIIIDTNLREGASDAEFDKFLSEWDALSGLRAVKENRVLVSRSKWFLIPGAHAGETLKLIAHWLHPDIFPDDVADPFLAESVTTSE